MTSPRAHFPLFRGKSLRFMIPMVLIAALLGGCTSDPYPEHQVIVLCYRTLADVTCHSKPDPGRDGRLVGFYLEPEQLPENAETALEWAKIRAEQAAQPQQAATSKNSGFGSQ